MASNAPARREAAARVDSFVDITVNSDGPPTLAATQTVFGPLTMDDEITTSAAATSGTIRHGRAVHARSESAVPIGVLPEQR